MIDRYTAAIIQYMRVNPEDIPDVHERKKANLEKVAGIGVDVYISEYDVTTTDDNRQKQIMEQQFPLFYEHSSVKGITLWGYIYGTTWSQALDSGLIRNGSLRPAMTWLMDYLDR